MTLVFCDLAKIAIFVQHIELVKWIDVLYPSIGLMMNLDNHMHIIESSRFIKNFSWIAKYVWVQKVRYRSCPLLLVDITGLWKRTGIYTTWSRIWKVSVLFEDVYQTCPIFIWSIWNDNLIFSIKIKSNDLFLINTIFR